MSSTILSGRRHATLLATGAVLFGFTITAQAQGFASYTCFQLWKERNSIYKSAGYCFKTDRAREYFGNAGCVSSNTAALPLSGRDKAAVAEVLQLERERGCQE